MPSKGTVPPTPTALCIHEGGFTLKTLEGRDENSQAYRLRHTVFSEELGWVAQSEGHMEKDAYDSHAIPIGDTGHAEHAVGLLQDDIAPQDLHDRKGVFPSRVLDSYDQKRGRHGGGVAPLRIAGGQECRRKP